MEKNKAEKRLQDAEAYIENCEEPAKLIPQAKNLRNNGYIELAEKAEAKAEFYTRLLKREECEARAEEKLPPPLNENDELEHALRAIWVKSCGLLGKVGSRSSQMAKRHGYVEASKRQASLQNIGSGNFEKLVELGGVEYTSEYQICTVLADVVDKEVLDAAKTLLKQQGVDV